ncbi:hypothetical protein A3I27_00705 [Candidatus Giovannonibacteria bacterium RIFCSPLOWO2_02_FULL_43_11b]|uniref:Uncharacterized protein n=1 Tax=Candidatus Giovannonibacteria bacterium RIFCSPHIGHO2_12_FULL_43_15 TaxID=1798341 RepID=A0A1F5WPJ0_9BACT|nr:MAG: hypothetical protein A3B97_01395 [Candidatus Giovannonibacteria bacterium RIFCSPHIGHO2_02_FULL_43_32]OGF77593.1 MAG: hypothetical protein A3F23_00105 [Candidatus Giovannonibacteria bacterium RIFCSPHIGHO2_12_FULL_43_15]OGF90174.1 MAG: hypothetical protein A3I27_00705 [Candidatus Giovannonibacteria bacterium RIFCSPLOWO2_02_FULL_43_11b]OGF92566.1 MAG: hypothetical protein A3H04_01945 [Candidatus Giovannonibacteria bacterium RIFCSPLOWO2_12_FULL_43_11c]
MITILISGLLGGVLRGLVGYVKYRSSYKNTPFMPGYFALSVGVSGVVGLLAAWVTEDLGISFLGLATLTPALGFVIGYAGGDFIENLFKIITGKTSLYQLPDLNKIQ